MPQLICSRVVEEGLSVVEQDAPDFRQAPASAINRPTRAILPTEQAAGHIAYATSGGPPLLRFAPAYHRAPDAVAASRLASGLEGNGAAVRPPLHATFTAATIERELERRDPQLALKTMPTDAVARCCLRSFV